MLMQVGKSQQVHSDMPYGNQFVKGSFDIRYLKYLIDILDILDT